MDLKAIRGDTPGCAHRIHLNNAGASLMPRPVLDEILEHLGLESRIGGYEAEAECRAEIAAAYDAVAELVGAEAHRVAFTEHATAAFVTALSAVPLGEGDLILTTRHDYVSNQIQYLSLQRRLGVRVERIPDAPEGGVDVDAMRAAIHRRRPRLVAVTHIPTNSGLVQDVAAIGAACRERDVWYLVDACQSVGQMPVQMDEIGCDFLSATARKFLRGPRGAGFLVVSQRVLDADLEPLFPDLRGADWVAPDLYQPAPDARRFETWEKSWALVRGVGRAARYALELGLDAIRERAWTLAAELRSRMAALDGVRVLDRGPTRSAIVTLSVEGHEPAALVQALRARDINTSSQTRLDALLDYEDKGVEGALRVSPHYFNTGDEIDAFDEALRQLIHR